MDRPSQEMEEFFQRSVDITLKLLEHERYVPPNFKSYLMSFLVGHVHNPLDPIINPLYLVNNPLDPIKNSMDSIKKNLDVFDNLLKNVIKKYKEFVEHCVKELPKKGGSYAHIHHYTACENYGKTWSFIYTKPHKNKLDISELEFDKVIIALDVSNFEKDA